MAQRHARGRSSSHFVGALAVRPRTMSRSCPRPTSTMLVAHALVRNRPRRHIRQRQRRLCHTSRTARPNAGRSTSTTGRSPLDHNGPPQRAQSGLGARRRMCTPSGAPASSSTPSTSTSPSPTSSSQTRVGSTSTGILQSFGCLAAPILEDPSRSAADPYRLHSDLIREEPQNRLRDRLGSRAHRLSFYTHPAIRDRIAIQPGVVRTAASASLEHDLGIVGSGPLDAYVKRGDLQAVRDAFVMEERSERANVFLRAVEDELWPFPERAVVAPPAVVAVDLLESRDERSRRAGMELPNWPPPPPTTPSRTSQPPRPARCGWSPSTPAARSSPAATSQPPPLPPRPTRPRNCRHSRIRPSCEPGAGAPGAVARMGEGAAECRVRGWSMRPATGI